MSAPLPTAPRSSARRARRWARWLAPFQIDVRSLAAARVASRVPLIGIYYTDAGVLPRAATDAVAGRLSLFALSGSYGWAALLFALQFVAALMFTVGYRTRLATALCLVLLYSQVNRNPILAHAGHSLEAWLLVWSLFLPMGAAASVDARASGFDWRRARARRVVSLGALAIQLQVLLIYWNAVTGRGDAAWVSNLDAIYLLLNSHLGTSLGHRLGQWPELCAAATVGTLALEALGPLLVLFAYGMPRLRTLFVLAFVAFHVGIGLTIYVTTFAPLCIAAWLLFLPAEFWDGLARRGGAWRVLVRGWHALIGACAAAVRRAGRAWPALVPRRVDGLRFGPVAWTALGALLAYVALVNLLVALPAPVARLAGPVARLPKLKQNWRVMTGAMNVFMTLQLDVRLGDGSTRTLGVGDDPRGAFRWTLPRATSRADYFRAALLPVESGVAVVYRMRLLRDSGTNKTAIAAFADFHRRRFDAAQSDPARRVVALQVYFAYEPIPAPGVPPARVVRPTRSLLYTWPADAAPPAADRRLPRSDP